MMACCLLFPTLPTAMTHRKFHRNDGTAHQCSFKRRQMAPLRYSRRTQLRYSPPALFTVLPNTLLCYQLVAPDRRQVMENIHLLLFLSSLWR